MLLWGVEKCPSKLVPKPSQSYYNIAVCYEKTNPTTMLFRLRGQTHAVANARHAAVRGDISHTNFPSASGAGDGYLGGILVRWI